MLQNHILEYKIRVGDNMKFIKNNKILIIIIAIVISVIIGLILFFTSGNGKETPGNSYIFSTEKSEIPGTITYSNEKLASKHCLNDVCISDVVFYYKDDQGRVEYKITNNSSNYRKAKSGYLKMVFDDKSLLVVYNNLRSGVTVKSQAQYMGMEIKNKEDYKLEKLTKKEISKLIK